MADPKIAPGAKSDFWSPKVTFPPRKRLLGPKSDFLPPKSLFCSRSNFSRFRPPKNVGIYKDYVGFAAVARTGAKKLEFTEFSEISTFGAKMSPKVTFSDFRSPKVTFRAQAHGCACSQWFLGVFYGPGELKCNFFVQNQLFVTFSTFAPKNHFLRKSDFLAKSHF